VDPFSLFDSFSKWMIGKGATTGFRLFLFVFCATIYSGQISIKETVKDSQLALTAKIDKVDVKIDAANTEYNSWTRRAEGRFSTLETLAGLKQKGLIGP
jgi:hypothetical protein